MRFLTLGAGFIDKFVYSETNDWDEVCYYPTTLSKVLLVVLIVAALVAAVLIAQAAKKKAGAAETESRPVLTVKQLTFCALAIALGTALSSFKLFSFPTGGSITMFSMLVICLPGYFFGLVPGLLTGLAYGLLQLLIDPYVLYPMQLVVDYILAFTALGLSGLFANSKFGILKGYIAGVLGRFVFAVISGWIFFGEYAWEGWSALPYSIVYNAIYIFAEAAVTIVVILLIGNSTFVKLKNMSRE